MGKTTITVSDETLSRFKSIKTDADDAQDGPDHSNESFLQALMDTWVAVDDEHYRDETRSDIIEDIRETLDDFDTEQTDLSGQKAIINRIDDLETELTRQHEGLKR